MTEPVQVDLLIQDAIAIRDYIKQIEAKYDEQLKKPKEALEVLKGQIQQFFTDTGQDNTKTAAGTAYLSTTYKASLSDPKAFMDYVIEHQLFTLLDRKANVTAVKAFVAKNKQLPPGVNLTGTVKVNVRRPGQKDDDEC